MTRGDDGGAHLGLGVRARDENPAMPQRPQASVDGLQVDDRGRLKMRDEDREIGVEVSANRMKAMATSVRVNCVSSARTSSRAQGPASKTNIAKERSTSDARVVPYSTNAAKAMPRKARNRARGRARMDFSVTRAGGTPIDRQTTVRLNVRYPSPAARRRAAVRARWDGSRPTR